MTSQVLATFDCWAMAKLNFHKLKKDLAVWTNVKHASCVAFLDHPNPEKRLHLNIIKTRSRVVIMIPSFVDGILEFCISGDRHMPKYFTMRTEDVPDEMRVELEATEQYLFIDGIEKDTWVTIHSVKYGEVGKRIYNKTLFNGSDTADISGESEVKVTARKYGHGTWTRTMKVFAGNNKVMVNMMSNSVF